MWCSQRPSQPGPGPADAAGLPHVPCSQEAGTAPCSCRRSAGSALPGAAFAGSVVGPTLSTWALTRPGGGSRPRPSLCICRVCPLQTGIRPANSICPGESGTRLPGSIWDSLPVLQPWGTQGPVHSPKSAHQPQAPTEPLMARGARCGSYPTAWYRERHGCPPGVHAAPGWAVGGRRAEGRAPTRCDAEGWVCSERSLPLPSEQPPPPLMQFGLGEASSYSGNRLA